MIAYLADHAYLLFLTVFGGFGLLAWFSWWASGFFVKEDKPPCGRRGTK